MRERCAATYMRILEKLLLISSDEVVAATTASLGILAGVSHYV